MKKAKKVISQIIGWTLVAVLTFVAGMSIYDLIKHKGAHNTLDERGYRNLVSVGDHSLNVYRAGNEDGEHTFVTLSGWSDGEMYIGWRPLTSAFEDENEFIFIDRPGYGLSDDVREDMTIANVVEDYRTVLHDSGEEGPYILLAHSLGSLYSAYWESTYPDEIEAVIIMDGTTPFGEELLARDFDFSMWERISISATLNWMQFAAKTGLARLGPSGYENVFYRLTEEDQDLALTMINRTIGSHYARHEMDELYCGELQTFTWNNIVTNDIPKIYIAASYFGEYASNYEDELIPYAERLGNTEIVDLPGDHVIFLDRTEECIEIIDDFLNGLG